MQSPPKSQIINLSSIKKSQAAVYLENYFLGWARDEKWNPGLHDVKLYFETYHEAFYVLEVLENNKYEVAAIIFAPFDPDSKQASIGTYISEKNKYRGQGFGYQLWKHVFQELNKKSENLCRTALYGVPAQVKTYEKSGFNVTHNILHYIMKTDQRYGPFYSLIEEVTQTNKSELLSYVKQNYSDGLARFIERGLDNQFIKVRIAFDTRGKSRTIVGFGMLRPLVDDKSFRYTIIADQCGDSITIADDLFRALNQLLSTEQMAVIDVREKQLMTDQYEYYSSIECSHQGQIKTEKYGQHWTTEMRTGSTVKDRTLSVAAEPSLETNFLPRISSKL